MPLYIVLQIMQWSVWARRQPSELSHEGGTWGGVVVPWSRAGLAVCRPHSLVTTSCHICTGVIQTSGMFAPAFLQVHSVLKKEEITCVQIFIFLDVSNYEYLVLMSRLLLSEMSLSAFFTFLPRSGTILNKNSPSFIEIMGESKTKKVVSEMGTISPDTLLHSMYWFLVFYGKQKFNNHNFMKMTIEEDIWWEFIYAFLHF